MSTLPLAWETASLSEVCTRIVDGSHNPPKASNSGLPMLSARNINDFQIVFDEYRLVSESDFAAEHLRTNVASGDVLLTIVGTIGRTAVVPVGSRPFVLQRSVAVLKPRGIDARYIAYALQSPSCQQWLTDNAKGTAQKGIYLKSLGTTAIPIAPRPEQTRIVEKLEELLSDLEAGVAELKAAQKKLALYRQSLLKAAVEGALTADWRARRATRGEALETGADLLARILTERRARWEARQLAKFKEQCKTPPKGWQAKYPEPAGPDSAGLPSLPKGWKWGCLDQLITESSYGTSVKCSYESSGPPVLRIPNVVAGSIDLSDLKFATQALDIDQSEFLAPGDLLVVRTNGSVNLVGRAAVVPTSEMRSLYFASYLLRLRCVLPFIIPSWISTFMASIQGRNWIERRAASSAGQHNISLSTLLTMPIPLAPLAEQAATLEALQQETQTIVEQEQATGIALKQSAAQRKNLLKAAFSGQLVPQDPNDEPASTLLARIRAERETRVSGSKIRRPRKTSHA